jgi:hypothetical protein
MRVNLTDARIRALKPDPAGKRRPELRDSQVPGLVLRLAAKRKTFVLHVRFPGAKHPTRRAIGEYGVMSIDQARTLARDWHVLIARGTDPAAEARRRQHEEYKRREAERLRQEGLFRNVADDYLKRKVKGQRRAREAERIVRNVLVVAWGEKSITEIMRCDVVRLVENINDRPAPIYAALVFSHARALFNWAINRGIYGLEHSPCDRVKVGDLVSRTKQPRQRVLSDDELRAFWKATDRLGYPAGTRLRRIVAPTREGGVVVSLRERTREIQQRDADVRLRREMGVQLRRPVCLDKEQLELLADVKFEWSDLRLLVELCTIYHERFRGPPLPELMLDDAMEQAPPTAELEARRAFVDAVEGVWRERRRKRGRGSSYRYDKEIHDGPLLQLLLKLFEAMGEPNPLSADTLHHDLQALHSGRERKRGRKHPR